MYDVVIVGAGPTGSYVAGKCAESGLKTIVMEEHPEIGFPVHCAGIVSDKLFEEFDIPEDLIQKKLTHFKIIDPEGMILECPGNIKANVIYRKKFDDFLADKAIRAGSEYLMANKVTDVLQNEKGILINFLSNGKKMHIPGRICILATGSMSNLPFLCGIDRPHSFLSSVQVDAEIENLDGVELYLGNKYAPGSFAYAVSINGNKSKLGIIVKNEIQNSFKNFIMSPFLHSRARNIDNNRVYRRIPLGFPCNSVNKRIIAVGDAAGQLKTTTGGGIYYGLVCARILSNFIVASRQGKDFDILKLNEYDQIWKKHIIKELRIGMLFRKFLENISDRDISMILKVLRRKSIFKIIESKADFDFHQKLILSLLKVPELHKIVFRLLTKSMRIFV